MKDEATDIIPVIALLGIVLVICLNIVLPMFRTSKELKYSEINDKTVERIEGEQFNNNADPGYSYSEIVLVASSQTYFMPTPRVLNLGDTTMSIQADSVKVNQPNEAPQDPGNGYVPSNVNTAIKVKQAVEKWCNDYTTKYSKDGFKLRFVLRFTPGTKESTDDDAYSLFAIGKTDLGKLVYLRCLPGGTIENNQDEKYELVYSE